MLPRGSNCEKKRASDGQSEHGCRGAAHVHVRALLHTQGNGCSTALLLNPAVPRPAFLRLCKILSLLVLYSDLFHVIYTKGLLKSWINFEIKF